MAESDKDQKTEQPTAGRLARAREQGQVPVSKELNNWFTIGAGTLVLLAFAPGMATSLTDALRGFIATPEAIPGDAAALEGVFIDTIQKAALIVAVPILLLLLAAIAGPLSQTGLLISTESLTPKFSKLNPIEGFHRLFSVRALVEFLKNLVKLCIIGSVGYTLVKPTLPELEHLVTVSPVDMVRELRQMVLHLTFGIFVTLTLIMIADVMYQRFSFMARMRMTKQEVKEESKQSEGDPIIKQRQRQLRIQRARARMMANVPKADVVITNPTHFAIALEYKPATMAAPVCLAKGQDLIALKIREVAKENRVAIVENKLLARALYAAVEIDEEVPPEHYKAVAEVISYVFRLRGRTINESDTLS